MNKLICDFCEDDCYFQRDGNNGHQLNIEIYPFNNFIGVTSFALDECGETDELYTDIEMNYCPVCGRKIS